MGATKNSHVYDVGVKLEYPWVSYELEGVKNDILNKSPASAISLTSSDDPRCPIRQHLRILHSNDVREYLHTLSNLAQSSDCPFRNSIQFVLLRSGLTSDGMYKMLCEDLKPDYAPYPSRSTTGSTIRKLSWPNTSKDSAEDLNDSAVHANLIEFYPSGNFRDCALVARYPQSNASIVLVETVEEGGVMSHLPDVLSKGATELALCTRDVVSHPLTAPLLWLSCIGAALEDKPSFNDEARAIMEAVIHRDELAEEDSKSEKRDQVAAFNTEAMTAHLDALEDIVLLGGLIKNIEYLEEENFAPDDWKLGGHKKTTEWARELRFHISCTKTQRQSIVEQSSITILSLQTILQQENREDLKRLTRHFFPEDTDSNPGKAIGTAFVFSVILITYGSFCILVFLLRYITRKQ